MISNGLRLQREVLRYAVMADAVQFAQKDEDNKLGAW